MDLLLRSTVSAGAPEGAVGGHIHYVGITGIDNDHTYMFRFLQSHIFPALASIFAFINAVSVGYAALVVVLPGPYPDHIGVVGIQGNAADGIGTQVVEDRLKRSAAVAGLPSPPDAVAT